jgi:hypothetical protein
MMRLPQDTGPSARVSNRLKSVEVGETALNLARHDRAGEER